MEVPTLIILGCLAMLVLAISIVLFVVAYQKRVLANQNALQLAENKHQVQLIEATILCEQQEREKIAKNLHDDLGTSLNVLKLNLEKLYRNSRDAEIVEQVSGKAVTMINHAIQDLRGISRDLMPSTLLKLGLVQSLSELSRHINDSGRIEVEFIDDLENKTVPEKLEIQLYRISQELLNNLLKHANPSRICLHVRNIPGPVIMIKFTHNGSGISNDDVLAIYADNKGVGLKSIESRIRMINGKINYSYDEQSIPTIEIKAPIAN